MLAIKADFTQIRGLIGKGADKLIPEAFGFEQNSTLGKELEPKGKIFKTRYLPGLQPAPGTRPLLSRLHGDGVRLGGRDLRGSRRVPTHSLNAPE
jgi:hypothetical protein